MRQNEYNGKGQTSENDSTAQDVLIRRVVEVALNAIWGRDARPV